MDKSNTPIFQSFGYLLIPIYTKLSYMSYSDSINIVVCLKKNRLELDDSF